MRQYIMSKIFLDFQKKFSSFVILGFLEVKRFGKPTSVYFEGLVLVKGFRSDENNTIHRLGTDFSSNYVALQRTYKHIGPSLLKPNQSQQ